MDSLASMAPTSAASEDTHTVLFHVWQDAVLAELVAVPAQETTTALREQLAREGTAIRSVWARSCLEASRLAFPECYAENGHARSHEANVSASIPPPSQRVRTLATILGAVSRHRLH